MIVSRYFQAKIAYFLYFQNINLYYYLLTFLVHAYLAQTAQVLKLFDGAKIRAQQRHRGQTKKDGSCYKANIT